LAGSPECILCWGSGADPKPAPGGRLIVVNTLETAAAKHADIWLQPRPATDLALALGILHVIINENLYDKDFVEKWTSGFDKLQKHVQDYPPQKVSEITWVPAEKIVASARLFAGSLSACLMNGNASEDTFNSTQCARALAIIQAVCGLLDVPGGTLESEGVPQNEATSRDILREKLPPSQEARKLGGECGYVPSSDLWYTIGSKPVEVHPQHLIDAVLTGKPYPVRAVSIFGSNPLLTWSNARRVYEALDSVDFLSVADMVMTPTAAMADIVLPVASYLETDGVVVSGFMGANVLKAQQKVVQIGECLSNQEIVMKLAEKLGLEDYFWKDLRACLDDYLRPVGLTFDELCRRRSLISGAVRYRKYLEKGFNTPSGKVELFSNLCEQWGYDPLPVYREPEETPFSGTYSSEYPLVLTSAHESDYVHSQDRHLAVVRKIKPGPLALIHPKTAAELDISEGDEIIIENPRGRIRQKASLNTGIDPRVVCAGYGWWFPEDGPSSMYSWDKSNLNILTDDSPKYSPEMGSPKMRGFLCKVYKC
ncbi:MAG: molybdopterin-dependent oxidoreductase, partial [Dehalococcoidales bacterium]|nr:molybdopterin-dependent oxidoreductase [Dehalococcoidales bacterium]